MTHSRTQPPPVLELHPDTPNFDRIARLYRPLEYLTLGRALEHCRLHFLPDLASRSHALVLGDGDGRFLAQLLRQNPLLHVDAVDTSAAMLQILQTRCRAAQARLQTHQTDALAFAATQPAIPYDLVVTHFFLDCLAQPQVDALASRIAPNLAPDPLWLVSDFRIPSGPLALPARLLVRSLYLAFRILTGLRISSLPDHEAALTRAGLVRIAQHRSFAGILTTELWRKTHRFSRQPTCNHLLVHTLLEHMGEVPPIPRSPDPAKQDSDSEPAPQHALEDPLPDPEPAAPSLPQPDPAVYP
jgi:SAM-dependent methyltransferase